LERVTASPAEWTAFLRSACRSYKCRFDEQVLIYAQRPDATAVLEIEKWNERFGRWVNRGAKGIAVFDDEHNAGYRLKHYFDISDTHESRFSRPVPLWRMEAEHEADVIEHLENSFGELADKSTLATALISAAKNAVEDNLTDYLSELMDCRKDSLLEGLDGLNVEARYRSAMQSSVAYMLLTRCGIDADSHLDSKDFQLVGGFSTRQTANALGLAASDISEMCLREIAATVQSLARQEEKQNRTFADGGGGGDNSKSDADAERSLENDNAGTDIPTGGGLPGSQPDRAGTAARSPWQVRVAPEEVPQGEPQNPVREPADGRDAERTSVGNRADGKREDGTADRADGTGSGSGREDESNRPDEVGGVDEQYQEQSGGNDTERPDIRIKPLPEVAAQLSLFGKAEEQNPSAFSISQQIIDEVLTSGGNEPDSPLRIVSYFKKDHPAIDNAAFLQEEYGTGGKGFIFAENHVSIWFSDNGLRIATGDTALDSERASLVTWEQAARRIRELLDMGRYMPQSELDKADGVEIKALAENLWYLRRDFADSAMFTFMKEGLFDGGFPESTARIADFVARPQEHQAILDGLSAFAEAYSQNRDLLRFPYSARYLKNALATLADLQRKPLVFAADETVGTARPGFITQDEVDRILCGNGDVRDGKYRIYSFFMQNSAVNVKEKADFLKHEYGTGGFGRTGFNEWHDGKGIAFSRDNNHMPYDKVLLTWPKAARRIGELIADGRYMSEIQLSHLPEYEKTELARGIRSFYQGQPEDSPRPFPYGAEYEESLRAIRPQLDEPGRVVAILSDMAQILDDTADFDRYYGSMQKAFSDLTAYQNGTFSLFGEKPAEKEQMEAGAPPSFPVPIAQEQSVPTDEAAEYDLQLGAVVWLGIDEFEIYSFDDDLVVLRDAKAPLFTRDMPRAEFDRKLRENRLNDRHIKSGDGIAAPERKPDEDTGQSHSPKIGDTYEIQGRRFAVDSVDTDMETVSLRDLTFEGGAGFPIFRNESFDFMRMYEPIKDLPAEKEESLTPSWEKPKPKSRLSAFDPHPEIPQERRHNYQITDDDLGAGGQKTKYRYNVEAIKTLQSIEAENRLATPKEQETLSRYVGWGALQEAFDERKPEWANEFAELRSLLSPEEHASARASTLNAHYTSPVVIKAIYKAVENMGFRTGNILEPSCGIGNFFGLVPESMADSKLFGVELDNLTGRIARQLYQKSSIAIQGFETAELPDSFFDLAIGNVPFGDIKVSDKRYDKHRFRIHDYFFARTLDKVRPGGIVAFVTSKGTLDKQNPAVRRYMAQRAELLGAIRLPNTAFKANAGTEVTSDIIFLQKRDRMIDIEPEWVHLSQTENGIPIGSYFAEHPEMVLGTMSNDSGTRMYGNASSTTCLPLPDADLAEQLSEAITGIHAEISDYEFDEEELDDDGSIPADPAARNFSHTIADGQIYYRENSRMHLRELSVTAQNRVRGMVEIRECVRTLIEYQVEDFPDADIRVAQARLNRLYDTFTRKYGLVNERANSLAFSDDESYPLLCSLEVLDENRKLKSKADMFTKRTINPNIPVTHADTAVEALAVSVAENARVDLDFMAQLTGMSEDALVKELEGVIFLNIGSATDESKTYVTADEYLSGNIREKLALARAAQETFPDGRYDVNVKALESAMPKDLAAPEISVRLGATWIPTDVIRRFIHEMLDTPWRAKDKVDVLYAAHTAEWNVTGKSVDGDNIKARSAYGTKRMNAYHIIEQSLNLRSVRVFDTVYEDGKEKQVLNKKETAIAQDKQEIIKAKFAEWIWVDPARRERLCKIYNEQYNSIRPREYDGSHIRFVGMNPEIRLDKHQIDAAARHLYGGNALFGHVVGAGKSFEMIAAAMEAKRIGLCNKSMFVVPNNIIGDFSGDFFRLYPSANVLMATAKDFEKKNRRKFCARIATGDYDGIIIAHSQFEKIPMSFERQVMSLERQIRDISFGIMEVKEQKGERFTIKQMEKTRKSLEVKLKRLNDQSRKDSLVTFEELGVDSLFIDEADLFKNLYLVTKMRNVGGISQTESQKASDLFMKTRYLDEITGNRGVVFATGTPISNSMAEMYTMQRYLQYDTLVKHKLEHFDCWASTFGETTTAMELTPEGTGFQLKTRFSSFYNLPELMAMFKEVADIQTKDMLNLPTPKVNFETIVTRPSETQEEMIAGLAERAEKIRGRKVDATEDNMLLITGDGRKIALDQRLANPLLPDFEGSKVNACADNVYRIWEETKDRRLTQLIFCDLSTPGKTSAMTREADGEHAMDGNRFTNVYDDIKRKLIAKGIPGDEVAFIHDAKNEVQKKEIFAKVRAGTIRVLMGSTSKMGAGTNVQDLLIASHDLDCPWRPREVGRALRSILVMAMRLSP
jgi:N12 class adenine-specific DNA methylase